MRYVIQRTCNNADKLCAELDKVADSKSRQKFMVFHVDQLSYQNQHVADEPDLCY